MIDVIAVGTDGSATADKAVEYALDLAVCHEAELVVLSAYDSKPSGLAAAAMATAWVPPGTVDPQWTPHEARRVDGVLADAKRRAESRGVTCRTAAFEGEPAEVLIELADAHGADLLVIGNRGMKRRVLGSVPNTVTHNARCSVLVVKTTD
jgi:nucleotide-binding universal stress UspA family protein